DRSRIFRGDEEHVERERLLGRRWSEFALGPGEIERAIGIVDEHGPAARADQPRDRHFPAERAQLVAALSAAHAVDVAAAIEARTAFAEPEDRGAAGLKRKTARGWIDLQHLYAWNRERERLGRELDRNAARLDGLRLRICAELCDRRAPRLLHE